MSDKHTMHFALQLLSMLFLCAFLKVSENLNYTIFSIGLFSLAALNLLTFLFTAKSCFQLIVAKEGKYARAKYNKY
jgi:hypothetical protein